MYCRRKEERIHLAVVACGERLEETVVMLKSAAILTKAPLSFHIFAEDQLHEPFKEQVGNPMQCLSKDLETGCLKLAVVKFLGVQIFKGDHNILIFQS